MRFWKVALLVDLALALGLGGGYLWWGREVGRLRQELGAARATRQQGQAGAPFWRARGIVRSVVPPEGVVYLTHETIPDLMPEMTMGFEAASPEILEGLAVGDPVRFTLQQKGDRLLVVGIQKDRRS